MRKDTCIALTVVILGTILCALLLAAYGQGPGPACEERLGLEQKRILLLQDEVNRAQIQLSSLWVKAETLEKQLAEAKAQAHTKETP